ncbi:MAG: TlpA disulfide reductase family protein [Acidobacteriota bacterium]
MAVLEPGSFLPPLTLQDADGRPAALPSGETLWAFFKSSCPTCELMWPYLDRLSSMTGDTGSRVVAVSQDDAAETKAFYERLSIDVPTLYDPPPWNASEAVGLSNVPTLFLVDQEGRIRDTVEGFQRAKMEELAARFSAQTRGTSQPESFFRTGESVPALRPG